MLGVMIGDVVGSRFEHHNHKHKEFDFFGNYCRVTDDTVMSLAVAEALLDANAEKTDLGQHVVKRMQEMGKCYPHAGYGGRFRAWLLQDNPQPYNSWGNGSAMRVAPCAYAATGIEEVKRLSRMVSEVTHNHPEGVKGAEAVAVAVYLARTGSTKDAIRQTILRDYYSINFTLESIRPSYSFDVSCQGSVPQALQAFFESTDFEDAIRNAVSIGGDSDTIAAITGGIAEAYYGVSSELRTKVLEYLDAKQMSIFNRFEEKYIRNSEKPVIMGSREKHSRITPENISRLAAHEVFVFGSNLAGHHGGGAARLALNHFGAEWGQGVGLQGQSYAIPTMQGGVETIAPYVDDFIRFAKAHPELHFLVTRIGCGIAGFRDEEIAPLFRAALPAGNISLPESFLRLLSPPPIGGEGKLSTLQKGVVLNGRFEILDTIGQGSFGITYKAYDKKLGRDIALKECFPADCGQRGADGKIYPVNSELYRKSLKDMVDEARTLASIEHPRIVRIYDVESCEGALYCVMEWVEGETLRERMDKRKGRVDEQTACQWLRETLQALACIHAKNIVHRDIKPANIIIRPSQLRPGEELVLVDFGSALNRNLKVGATIPGPYTPAYAASEQVATNLGKIGPWTDMYALAATFYELLGGSPVHSLNGEEPPKLNLQSEILEKTLMKNLSPLPKDRCSTAREWLDELSSVHPDLYSRSEADMPEHGMTGTRVAVIGGSMAGNSALINELVGADVAEKVSGGSTKPGIHTYPLAEGDCVLLDIPSSYYLPENAGTDTADAILMVVHNRESLAHQLDDIRRMAVSSTGHKRPVLPVLYGSGDETLPKMVIAGLEEIGIHPILFGEKMPVIFADASGMEPTVDDVHQGTAFIRYIMGIAPVAVPSPLTRICIMLQSIQ